MEGKESTLAIAESVGMTIATINVDESEVAVCFDDGSKLTIWDDGQSCCESRWLTCDDDVAAFEGAQFVGAHTSSVGEWDGDESEFDCHDVEFLVVETSLGSFTVATHVDSNGYYGGFWIRAKRTT